MLANVNKSNKILQHIYVEYKTLHKALLQATHWSAEVVDHESVRKDCGIDANLGVGKP